MATIHTESGNQPVDPYKSKSAEDPPLAQKVEDLVDFISESKYGMLTTKMSDSELLTSRCMALAGKVSNHYLPGSLSSRQNKGPKLTRSIQENGGIDLIFHTNLFAGKTLDLSVHPQETNMSFLNQTSGSWASISGTAHILSDPAIVQKYYSPTLSAWLGDLGDGVHDGSPSDPRIGVIRLEAKAATYSLARRGMFGRTVETVKSVATGDVPVVNSIRELNEGELAECECSRGIELGDLIFGLLTR